MEITVTSKKSKLFYVQFIFTVRNKLAKKRERTFVLQNNHEA